MENIIMMYITLLPIVFAGIINSIFCKKFKYNYPIDFNKNFIDGKRIFGKNKTWKGFIGYIFFSIIFTIIWGIICNKCNLNHLNYFYINYSNTYQFNIKIGILIGFFYALFELPNSFIKRRLNIIEGKNTTGLKKIIFIFIDQADSIFGCALVVWMFYDLGIFLYLLFVIVGAITHIVINILLYLLHLRKNMF